MASLAIKLTDGTFVYGGYPTQAYGKGETYFRVGRATYSNWTAKSLIRANVSAIPAGAIINSATLWFYSQNLASSSSSNAITFYVRRVTGAWTNDQTWNTMPATTTTGQATVSNSGWNKWYEVDIKTIVQAWVNGTANHGLALVQDNATLQTTKTFAKSGTYGAELVIDYTEPIAKLTGFSNFNTTDGSIGFSVSNPGGGALTAALKIGSATIFSGVAVTSATGNKTISISATYRNKIYDAMPTATTAKATLTLTTTGKGTDSRTATVTIPTSVIPSVTSVTLTGATPAGRFTAAKNYAVKGVGTLTATASGVTIPRGTTENKRTWTLNSGSSKTGVSASWPATVAGMNTAAVIVQDMRGRNSASKSGTANVTDYAPVSLTLRGIDRAGVDLEDVDVTVTRIVHALGGANKWRLRVQTKLTTSSTWQTAYESAITDGGASGNTTVRLTLKYDQDKIYDLRVTLEDDYTSMTTSDRVATIDVPLSIGTKGIGAGKIWQQGALDVEGDIWVNGEQRCFGASPITTTTYGYHHASENKWYRLFEIVGEYTFVAEYTHGIYELRLMHVYNSPGPECFTIIINHAYDQAGISVVSKYIYGYTNIFKQIRLGHPSTTRTKKVIDLLVEPVGYQNGVTAYLTNYPHMELVRETIAPVFIESPPTTDYTFFTFSLT